MEIIAQVGKMAHGHPVFYDMKSVRNIENCVACIGFFNWYSYAESTAVDFLLYFRWYIITIKF